MGIRAALGASAARLVRLVLMEGVAIAGMAGAIALRPRALDAVARRLVRHPDRSSRSTSISTPDATVLGFIAAARDRRRRAAGTLARARGRARRRAARAGIARRRRGRAESRRRMRRGLVGAQIAGSTVFLAIAALVVAVVRQALGHQLGFDHDQLVVAEFEPASHGYDADRSERYAQRAARAGAGAAGRRRRGAGGSRCRSSSDSIGMTPVSSTGAPCEPVTAARRSRRWRSGPGYFRTMGIRLVAGREFEESGASTDVIVNQPLAQAALARRSGPRRDAPHRDADARDHGHRRRHHREDAHARI